MKTCWWLLCRHSWRTIASRWLAGKMLDTKNYFTFFFAKLVTTIFAIESSFTFTAQSFEKGSLNCILKSHVNLNAKSAATKITTTKRIAIIFLQVLWICWICTTRSLRNDCNEALWLGLHRRRKRRDCLGPTRAEAFSPEIGILSKKSQILIYHLILLQCWNTRRNFVMNYYDLIFWTRKLKCQK